MSLFLVAAALIFVVHLVVLAEIILGLAGMQRLSDVEVDFDRSNCPRVSVIVPACNEEEAIAGALDKLLEQDYPNMEIIVVNDRSTDRTGDLVEEIVQKRGEKLKLLTIEQLPDGWLGKSYAMHRGSQLSSGDILLFTDADIMMEPTSVSRAVTALIDNNVDHLPVVFQPREVSWLLNAMVLDAASGLFALFKPWRVQKKSGRLFIGVGAFNMIRANAYRAFGGHTPIRMHPIDDLMLGKMVKQYGFSQICLLGHSMIKVHWYRSVGEMIEGLMKNVFSVFHYRLWLVVPAVLLMVVIAVLPIGGLLFGTGWVMAACGGTILIRLVGTGVGTWVCDMGPATVAGGLLAPFVNIYIVIRAVLITLHRGGVSWRGTFYALDDLRKSPPLLF